MLTLNLKGFLFFFLFKGKGSYLPHVTNKGTWTPAATTNLSSTWALSTRLSLSKHRHNEEIHCIDKVASDLCIRPLDSVPFVYAFSK